MYLTIMFSVVALCITQVRTSDFSLEEKTRCIAWAIQKMAGVTPVSPAINATAVPSVRNEEEDLETRHRGPNRPGKRGAPGPRGLPGPRGPPGVCDCIPDEMIEIHKKYADLEEKLRRVRITAPEELCLLGMKSSDIPTSAISVSSNPGSKSNARLDSSGWAPSSYTPGDVWIMADLGKVRTVTGIVTQGYYGGSYWVKSYQVEYSTNGSNFTDVKKSDGSELVFNGNTDYSSKAVRRFPSPVQARFVRIYPLTYNAAMYIRFDMIDC